MRIPKLVIPAIIVFFALLTIPLKGAFNYPAAQVTLSDGGDVQQEDIRELEMIVQGVKCKGTADYFISRYNDQEGILDMTAFAADHKVVLKYDSSKVSLETIKRIAEAPVTGNDGHEYDFFVIKNIEEK
ncbi:hypothetical protein ACFLU6_04020 [Acidobacteriota bacterium]